MRIFITAVHAFFIGFFSIQKTYKNINYFNFVYKNLRSFSRDPEKNATRSPARGPVNNGKSPRGDLQKNRNNVKSPRKTLFLLR